MRVVCTFFGVFVDGLDFFDFDFDLCFLDFDFFADLDLDLGVVTREVVGVLGIGVGDEVAVRVLVVIGVVLVEILDMAAVEIVRDVEWVLMDVEVVTVETVDVVDVVDVVVDIHRVTSGRAVTGASGTP